MGQAGSTCERSSCNHGSEPLWWRILAALPAGCSIRTVTAGLTGYGHVSRTATTGTSMRDIYLQTSPVTFSGCAVRPWISSGSLGASPGGTPYRWHAAKRWRDSTRSSAPSTEVSVGLGAEVGDQDDGDVVG